MLAGIQPAELRRKGATPSLARRPMEPGHLSGNAWHLKRDTYELLCPLHNSSSVHLTTVTEVRPSGRIIYETTRLRTCTPYPPPWKSSDKNSVGPTPLHKWGMAASVAYECGEEDQTVDNVVFQFPIHRL